MNPSVKNSMPKTQNAEYINPNKKKRKDNPLMWLIKKIVQFVKKIWSGIKWLFSGCPRANSDPRNFTELNSMRDRFRKPDKQRSGEINSSIEDVDFSKINEISIKKKNPKLIEKKSENIPLKDFEDFTTELATKCVSHNEFKQKYVDNTLKKVNEKLELIPEKVHSFVDVFIRMKSYMKPYGDKLKKMHGKIKKGLNAADIYRKLSLMTIKSIQVSTKENQNRFDKLHQFIESLYKKGKITKKEYESKKKDCELGRENSSLSKEKIIELLHTSIDSVHDDESRRELKNHIDTFIDLIFGVKEWIKLPKNTEKVDCIITETYDVLDTFADMVQKNELDDDMKAFNAIFKRNAKGAIDRLISDNLAPIVSHYTGFVSGIVGNMPFSESYDDWMSHLKHHTDAVIKSETKRSRFVLELNRAQKNKNKKYLNEINLLKKETNFNDDQLKDFEFLHAFQRANVCEKEIHHIINTRFDISKSHDVRNEKIREFKDRLYSRLTSQFYELLFPEVKQRVSQNKEMKFDWADILWKNMKKPQEFDAIINNFQNIIKKIVRKVGGKKKERLAKYYTVLLRDVKIKDESNGQLVLERIITKLADKAHVKFDGELNKLFLDTFKEVNPKDENGMKLVLDRVSYAIVQRSEQYLCQFYSKILRKSLLTAVDLEKHIKESIQKAVESLFRKLTEKESLKLLISEHIYPGLFEQLSKQLIKKSIQSDLKNKKKTFVYENLLKKANVYKISSIEKVFDRKKHGVDKELFQRIVPETLDDLKTDVMEEVVKNVLKDKNNYDDFLNEVELYCEGKTDAVILNKNIQDKCKVVFKEKYDTNFDKIDQKRFDEVVAFSLESIKKRIKNDNLKVSTAFNCFVNDKYPDNQLYSKLADNLLLKMGNALGHIKKHAGKMDKAKLFLGRLIGNLPGVDTLEERVTKAARDGLNAGLYPLRTSHDTIVQKGVKAARRAFSSDGSEKMDPTEIFNVIVAELPVHGKRIDDIQTLVENLNKDNKNKNIKDITELYQDCLKHYNSSKFSDQLSRLKSQSPEKIVVLAKELQYVRLRALKMIKELKKKSKVLPEEMVQTVKNLKTVLKSYENQLLNSSINKQHSQIAQCLEIMLKDEKVAPAAQALKSINDDIVDKLFFRHRYVNMNLLSKLVESTLFKMKSTVDSNPHLQKRVEFVTV